MKNKAGVYLKIALPIAIVAVIILAVVIVTADTLPSGSKIGGVSVGGLGEKDISQKVQQQMNDISLYIDDTEYSIQGNYEIASDKLKGMIKRCAYDPFYRNKLKKGITIEDAGFEYMSGIKSTAKVLDKEEVTDGSKSKDAYVDLETMSIVPEVQGTQLDGQMLSKDLYRRLVTGKDTKFAAKDYMIPPLVKSDDEELLKELAYDETYLTKKLTIEYPGGYEHTFTVKELSKFSVPNKEGEVWTQTVNEEAIAKYMKKHRSYTPSSVTIKTKKGKKTLYNSCLEGQVNLDESCDRIARALEEDKKHVKLEWDSYPRASTRVEVSIDDQKLWYIEDDDTVFTTPVVTGGPGHGTDKGIYQVAYKTTNVDLKGRNDDGSKYSSHVDWWMPFNGDEGLHDADWRGSFGGNIYKYNGSHGCVNMPESAAAKLYKKVDAGTIVIVY